MKKPFLLSPLLLLILVGSGAATSVYFPVLTMTGDTNDVTINVRAVNNPVIWNATAYYLPKDGTNLTTSGGYVTNSFVPGTYTASIPGLGLSWTLYVTNSASTLNAMDLARGLVRMSQIQTLTGREIQVTNDGLGNFWITDTNAAAGGVASNVINIAASASVGITTNSATLVTPYITAAITNQWKIDATNAAGGVSISDSQLPATISSDITGNAATATTATNLSGGLVNSWREIYRTNQFGEQMADQLAFPLSRWVLTKKLFATNSTDAGGLRVSSCIVDPPYLRIYYAGYTNSLWNQVNSGGRIIMATATNWDGPWNKQVVINRGASGEWDSGNIGGARVYRFGGGTNYLYYFAGTNTLFETDNQSCGVAYSTDGTNWTKYSGNPIVTRGDASSWENYSVQGAQCVIQYNQGYIMYYGARGSNNVECIGMAFADNPLGPWTKYSGNPVLTNAAVNVFAEPNVFPVQNGTGWAMLLGTGMAVSQDLTNWVYTGSPTIADPLNLDEGVWFTVSPFVFSDDGYAALYDNAAGVYLARPWTAEDRVQYSGIFYGNGLYLTNVDAKTAVGGIIQFDSNGDSFWMWPGLGSQADGLYYDVNTNGWSAGNTFRAATYYGSGAGLSAIPASAMAGGSQGQVVTWHGSGAIWSNPPAGGSGGGWTGNANQFAVAGGTTNIKSGAYFTNDLHWGTVSFKSGDGDDDVTVTNVGAYLQINSAANPFTAPTKIGEDITSRSFVASGTYTGNGSGLTNLNASSLASGTVADARIASTIARDTEISGYGNSGPVTNGQYAGALSGFTLGGTFTGPGYDMLSTASGNIRGEDITAEDTITTTNANILGALAAGSFSTATANAGSFYPTNTYTLTNGLPGDIVIPAGKVSGTNISANLTVTGFSGVDHNYWRGGMLWITNGTANNYSITFETGTRMATNSFVLSTAVWCTNRAVTIISHGVGFNTTNIAAAAFY